MAPTQALAASAASSGGFDANPVALRSVRHRLAGDSGAARRSSVAARVECVSGEAYAFIAQSEPGRPLVPRETTLRPAGPGPSGARLAAVDKAAATTVEPGPSTGAIWHFLLPQRDRWLPARRGPSPPAERRGRLADGRCRARGPVPRGPWISRGEACARNFPPRRPRPSRHRGLLGSRSLRVGLSDPGKDPE